MCKDINYLILDNCFDPNYVCALDCWEEPSLSPGELKSTLPHIWLRLYLPIDRNANSSDRPNNNRLNNNNSQSQDNFNSKWIINLSSTSLTEGQKSVLAKGPNHSLTPKYIPNVDYITVVESMYSKLKQEEAMELRSDVSALLRKAKAPEY